MNFLALINRIKAIEDIVALGGTAAAVAAVAANVTTALSNLTTLLLLLTKQKKCYPTLANSVNLPTHANAWTLGTKTEIVPANGIVTAFVVDELVIDLPAADDYYEVVLYTGLGGAEVEFARARFKGVENIRIPVSHASGSIAANTRISGAIARLTAAASVDVAVHLSYRT